MKPFLIKDIIKSSYEAFKSHWGVIWGMLFVVFAINVAFSVLGEFAGKEQWQITFLVTLFSIVVSFLLQLGIIRVILNVADGKEASIGQLFSQSALLLRFIGASIVYGLIVIVGFILLIVPGIIWSIKYGQYKMLIVDKNMGILESIKESGRITAGAKMRLFLLGLTLALLLIVAVIPIGLGLLVMVPIATVAPAFVYRKLLVAKGATFATSTSAETKASTEGQKPFVPLGDATEDKKAEG